MVKLTKIYTRGGDKGETSLGGGARVKKHSIRVAAYGSVDETNAVIGVARLHVVGLPTEIDHALNLIQNDLFDLGADLARPIADTEEPGKVLRIVQAQVDRLEREIDGFNADLGELTSFILRGGHAGAAHLHHACTVARRAEREATALAEAEQVNELAVKYLNRLSDHLFVLARFVNKASGTADVLWVPGQNR